MIGLRSRALIFGAALLLAVLVALGAGYAPFAKLAPVRPDARAGLGQAVTAAGVTYRLDAVRIADSFPAQDAGDPAVHGPAGSRIVLVEFTQTIGDRAVDFDDYYCDFTLHGPDTVWQPDGDYTYAMRRPAASVCSSTKDLPLAYDRPRTVGITFVVPAAATDQLSLWISVDEGRTVVELGG